MNQNKKFNPDIHHRKAMRLKGHNYAQAGLYFVTICTQNKQCIFGEIENGRMIHNAAGLIAIDCWTKIPDHFPDASLHEYIIMPNHVHGIIELTGCRDRKSSVPTSDDDCRQSQQKTIGSIVKGFKIGVTKQLRYPAQDGPAFFNDSCPENRGQSKIWQSRFHDHIIRNNEEYYRISNYIINNPENWIQDTFHTHV